jgi:hypothetical protein
MVQRKRFISSPAFHTYFRHFSASLSLDMPQNQIWAPAALLRIVYMGQRRLNPPTLVTASQIRFEKANGLADSSEQFRSTTNKMSIFRGRLFCEEVAGKTVYNPKTPKLICH